MKAITALLVGLALILSGCLTLSDSENHELVMESCYDIYCMEVSATPTATFLYETYGVEQIKISHTKGFIGDMDNGLYVWQASRDEGDRVVSDIVGYDVVSREFVPIDVGTDYRATNPIIHDGTVVYKRDDGYGANQTLITWNRHTGKYSFYEPAGPGLPRPSGFDGNWLVYHLAGAWKQAGIYAINVHNGTSFQVYQEMPAQHENNTNGLFMGGELWDGVFYYGTMKCHRGEERCSFSHQIEMKIHEHDLNDGGLRTLFREFEQLQLQSMDISARYIAFSFAGVSDSHITVKDRQTGEWMGPFGGDGTDYMIKTAGDWLVYRSNPDQTLKAIHLPTQQEIVIIPEDGYLMPTIFGTDGEYVVFGAAATIKATEEGWFDDWYEVHKYLFKLPDM